MKTVQYVPPQEALGFTSHALVDVKWRKALKLKQLCAEQQIEVWIVPNENRRQEVYVRPDQFKATMKIVRKINLEEKRSAS